MVDGGSTIQDMPRTRLNSPAIRIPTMRIAIISDPRFADPMGTLVERGPFLTGKIMIAQGTSCPTEDEGTKTSPSRTSGGYPKRQFT